MPNTQNKTSSTSPWVIAYSILAYSLILITSAITIPPLSTIVIIYSLFTTKRKKMKLLRRLIKIYGKTVIYSSFYPLVRIKYHDSNPPTQQTPHTPGIYIANHRSSSDPFLMAYLPGEIIQTVNIWPFKIPIIGQIAKIAGYISIRELSFEELTTQITTLINSGVSIAGFPEGTRSGNKTIGQFNSALFRIAQQINCPIYPIAITGNQNTPSKNYLMQPATITIHKLPAITNINNTSAFKLKNKIRQIIIAETNKIETNKE